MTPLDRFEQKQVAVNRAHWTALIAYCGVAHTGSEYVSEWMIAHVNKLAYEAPIDRLIDALITADVWLQRFDKRARYLSFSIGAFVGSTPEMILVSNFEDLATHPGSRSPADALMVSRRHPRGWQLFLSGRPRAVSVKDQLIMRARLTSQADVEQAFGVLAAVNARSAMSPEAHNTVSRGCFTAYLAVDGSWGGKPHGIPENRDYIPGFAYLGLDALGAGIRFTRAMDDTGSPKPIQLRGIWGARVEQTEEFLTRALKETPNNPSMLSNYGNWLREHGRPDAAEERYRRAIAVDPDFVNAHTNYALLLDDLNRIDEAKSEYERGIKLYGQDAVAITNFATFTWRRLKNRDAASKLFEKALGIREDAYTLSRAAWFNEENPGRADSLYQQALAASPGDPFANCRYAGFRWQRLNDPDSAEAYYERAMAQESPPSWVLSEYGIYKLVVRDDAGAAKKLAQRALRRDSRNPEAHMLSAHIADRSHAASTVIEAAYRRALTVAPDNSTASANLAQLVLIEGDTAEGQVLLESALAGSPQTDTLIEVWFYRYCHGIGPQREAILHLDSLLASGARSPGWNLQRTVDSMPTGTDASVSLAQAIADVITGGPFEDLSRLPEWAAALRFAQAGDGT
jgi:Tfp pilus assembly protein PilF